MCLCGCFCLSLYQFSLLTACLSVSLSISGLLSVDLFTICVMSLTRVVLDLFLLYKTEPVDSSSEQPGIADEHIVTLGESFDFLLHEQTLHLITVTSVHCLPWPLFKLMPL